MEWYAKVMADEKLMREVCTQYRIRCPPPPDGEKRKTFPILQYLEERRQETALILDGVYEMMDERMYCHWMAKPKNGAVEMEPSLIFWGAVRSTPIFHLHLVNNNFIK